MGTHPDHTLTRIDYADVPADCVCGSPSRRNSRGHPILDPIIVCEATGHTIGQEPPGQVIALPVKKEGT